MEPRFVRCAPGAPAAAAVAAEVARSKAGDPLVPVRLVVRAEDAAVHARRAVARAAGGIAAVEALPLDRLARALRAGGDGAGTAPRPLVAAALRRAAHTVGGPIGAAADQQATQDALVAAHHELTALGETTLDEAQRRSGVAGTVARIVTAARRSLLATGWLDDAGRLARAAAAAATAPAATDPIVVWRAELPTPVEHGLLAALGYRRRLAIVEAVEQAAPPQALVVRRVSDPDEEVRAALRVLADALAQGVPPDRCALAFTVDDPYRRIAAEQLNEAGLPWNGRAGGSLLESRAGRRALDCGASGGPAAASWRDLAERLAADVAAAAPDDERTAAVVRLCAQLAHLDVLGAPPGPPLVAATIRAELAAVLPTVGRVGSGITVGSLRRVADGAPWQVVVVVGLAEGWAPAGGAGSSLLGDGDRLALGLPTAATQAVQQRARLGAVLADAGAAWLSWPIADLRRTARRARSRWLDEIVAQARAGGVVAAEADAPSAFAATTRHPSPLATDHRRRLALAEPDRLAARDDAFARRSAAVRARHAPSLTAFDGDLTGEDLGPLQLDGRALAPTALESFARCGRAYFTTAVLGVHEPHAFDELIGPDARTEGALVHRVLERAVRAEQRAGRPLTRAEQADVVAGALATRAEDLARLPPLVREQHHRSHLARLWRAIEADDDVRALGRTPLDVEVRFGDDEPFTIALPGGRRLALRGTIDRVDRDASGTLTVVDYKSGSRLRGGNDDDPLLSGIALQLAVYASAAEARFDAPVETVEYLRVGRDKAQRSSSVAAPLRAALGPVVEALVERIERGLFVPGVHPPGRPGYGTCPVCDAYGLLARAQGRRVRRLLGAPAADDETIDDG